MKVFVRVLIAAVLLFLAVQAIRPRIPERRPAAELQAPPEVKRILDRSCYSCHSDQRRLAWFDQVVPAYWLARADILSARRHLDFSTLGARPPAAQKAALYEAVNMIQLGAMPLPRYLSLHPEARVSAEDLQTLKAYLAPWATLPASATASSGTPAPVSLSSVRPALNGIPFDARFESWQLLSATDRGDNGTFRFILGNDVAIHAAQSGSVSPWPDGTRFAKIAWQQVLGPDGLVHPGKFVQVEFMIKDARQYKPTDGWGWARWRGLDLKPYGSSAHFVDECVTCHRPVRGNDFVYTLPITTAAVSRDQVVNNRAANFPSSLPYRPLAWSAITMFVDPKSRTTATLYGNDVAIRAIRQPASAQAESGSGPAYPANSVLALVTWTQRDDPHWFGARIPDAPLSVEFVEVGPAMHYRKFAGMGLSEVRVAAGVSADRTKFITGLAPVQLP